MVPIRLKIQGLYSYQGPQEIDFGPLLEAGLFGIFGGVGSGKSTILEAMTFALYSQTDRLGQRGDDRLYNMMNLQSNDFLVDFECYAGPEGHKYRFVTKAQRNRRRFTDVPRMDRTVYQWLENTWRPIQETISGEQIIGLSYDNFRRTIIIPQGRFQDFIELKGQDRTEMMKEIFQLEKFDLAGPVAKLQRENRQKMDILAGQLVGVEDVHPERLDALFHEEKLQKELLDALTREYQQLQLVHETLSALATWKAQEQTLQLREQTLQSQAGKMASLREELAQYDHVQAHYQTAKVQWESSLHRWQEWTEKQQTAQKETEQAHQKLQELQLQRANWQVRLAALDQNRQDLLRWQGEEKLLEIQEQWHATQQQKTILEEQYQRLLQEEIQFQAQKQQLTHQWEQNQQQIRADFHDISTQIQSWHQARHTILQQKNDLKADADQIKKQEGIAQEKITAAKQALAPFGENVDTLYLQERQKLEEASTQWHVRQSWSHLVTHLHDGSPCPVCGSLDHPAPATLDLTQQRSLEEIQKKQKALEDRYHQFKQKEKEVEINESALPLLAAQRAEVVRRWELNKQQLQQHDAAFPGDESSWREEAVFSAWGKTQKELYAHQAKTLTAQRELDQRIQTLQIRSKEFEARVIESQKQEHAQQVLWQTQRAHLLQDPQASSVLDAQQRQTAIQQTILQGETAFAAFEKQSQHAHEVYQATQQSLQHWQELVSKELATLTANRQTLEDRCLTDPVVGSWDQLTKLLSLFNAQTLPLARQSLANYQEDYTKWEEASRQWREQGKQFGGLTYETEQHQLAQQALLDIQHRLDEGKNHMGALIQQRTDVERKIQEKAELILQKSLLEQRKSELDTMERLFRGQGFVNFVSRIFLEQLCAVANQRFERMTRGQLQLKIGPENTFWVVDRLHGGKERLLKTLSGGQKFQASLALALALADGIQQKLRLEQHFFFIDEGFGSLDRDSLQVVFETLTSLRQEKRRVGVISHVEDLQQEIQTYLHIKRLDSGSQITKSWEI